MYNKLVVKILSILLIIVVLGLIVTSNPSKSFIKSMAVRIVNKVNAWETGSEEYQARQKDIFLIESSILLDQDPIVFAPKLVFNKTERIFVNVISDKQLLVSVFKTDKTGSKVEIVSKEPLNPNNWTPVLYNSATGIQKKAVTFELGTSHITPGWFSFVFEAEGKNRLEVPVFIEDNSNTEKIIFVESTDTLLAYNPAANYYKIPNFYSKKNHLSQSIAVPENTPILYNLHGFIDKHKINCKDHLINADMIHKHNLYRMGYQFSNVSDNFLDKPISLEKINTIILGSHNEYWTKEKAQNVIDFVENGGKLLLLGGNTAWRQIYRLNNSTFIHGHGLQGKPIFKRLIETIIGGYSSINADFTVSDFDTYAPFTLKNRTLLKERFGINMAEESVFGSKTDFEKCQNEIFGGSGHEMDKLFFGSSGFSLIAKGQNFDGGAEILFKQFEAGGSVLNFGSISIWHVLNDKVINGLIKGFLNK